MKSQVASNRIDELVSDLTALAATEVGRDALAMDQSTFSDY